MPQAREHQKLWAMLRKQESGADVTAVPVQTIRTRKASVRRRWLRLCAGFPVILLFFSAAVRAEVIDIDQNGTQHRLCALGTHPVAHTDSSSIPAAYRAAMQQAATQYAISTDLLDAVARQESAYNPGAVSPKGAVGIMQLMPGTAKILGVDPYDPAANIRGGAKYLRYLLDTFNGEIDLALGAYNAGQNAIIRHGGLPPYPETRAYVANSLTYLAHISVHDTDTTDTPTCQ